MSYSNTTVLTIILVLNKESQMSKTCCFCNVIVFNCSRLKYNFRIRNLTKATGNIDKHCFSDKIFLGRDVIWSAYWLVRSTSRAWIRKLKMHESAKLFQCPISFHLKNVTCSFKIKQYKLHGGRSTVGSSQHGRHQDNYTFTFILRRLSH